MWRYWRKFCLCGPIFWWSLRSCSRYINVMFKLSLLDRTWPLLSYIIFLFQNKKSPIEEGECSTNDRTHAKPFLNGDLWFYNVWLYNFDGSNDEEFAFASHLLMQKTVIIKMMIETSSFPPTKKLNAEAAVAKLMELPKRYKHFIECFWWNFGSINSINCLLAFSLFYLWIMLFSYLFCVLPFENLWLKQIDLRFKLS